METAELPTPAQAICRATGLTLAQLADELNVSPSTARSWSCGRLEMSDMVLRRISYLFEVDLGRLLNRGECVLRDTAEPLTPETWARRRAECAETVRFLESRIAENLTERTPVHGELTRALRRAADRGDLMPVCAEIVAYLRSVQ